MADALYEVLTPYFDGSVAASATTDSRPLPTDPTTSAYLARLPTLSLQNLTTTEASYLNAATQSSLRSLQALAKRSHRSVITATDHLSHLSTLLPSLYTESTELGDALPSLESAATDFATKYDRAADNAVLDRRKRAMLLSRNVDRVSDVLELPTLLSTAINSSSTAVTQGTGGAAASGYASALDLHAHVKRLRTLYPDSDIVGDISRQADDEIQNLITVLINGLQNPALKLAGAMRMIGWLRRVAPELADDAYSSTRDQTKGRSLGAVTGEGSLGSLFLVCRLGTLRRTLEALDPLRDLADQEASRRSESTSHGESWIGGTQTERYLKRYVEVFREQSFAIISMYKSIFPSALPIPGLAASDIASPIGTPAQTPTILEDPTTFLFEVEHDKPPSALATFAPHLVDMLFETLRAYMPNMSERSSRDSLLTQVLYCAGSLGRLGADFGMMLALLEDELREEDESGDMENMNEDEHEWVQVMKKHRVQASRLELLASGVGSGRKTSTSLESRGPSAVPG
ncbi:Dor1-domain-containing protein [Aureobasidium subglaciale]|nr:Dor1-domain-containing protein [Aureobasidium subglaciale]